MMDAKHQSVVIPNPEDLPKDVIISQDTRRANRLPPDQVRTRKWPVLDAQGPPRIDTSTWSLEINGLVEQPLTLSWSAFRALPRIRVFADFHCVTRWSRLGNLWEGVATRELLRHVRLDPGARFALVRAYDGGWTTNLPLEAFLAEDALFADTHDGEPISLDHGGPVRLVVPQLYAWKSAKWISGVEFLTEDQPGFWEDLGYHMNGNPWREERYRFD